MTDAPKKGWFSRLTEGLSRSSKQMTDTVVAAFVKEPLSEAALEGLEEHLLQMFRDDFEFGEGNAPSHLAAIAPTAPRTETAAPSSPAPVDAPLPATWAQPEASAATSATPTADVAAIEARWSAEAEKELSKIPFFVRGKARRNTERFAKERGLTTISIETLYDAKAHYSR